MAMGMGTGAQMMQPVAIVCIGGLLYATLMTLFVVPAMYDIMNKKKFALFPKKSCSSLRNSRIIFSLANGQPEIRLAVLLKVFVHGIFSYLPRQNMLKNSL